MHELSLAQALLEQVRDAAVAHGSPRVRTVKVTVGALAGVEKEALRFGFESLRAEYGLADAGLELTVQPAVLRCAACGAETAPTGALRCTDCGGSGELIAGRTLELTAIDVEDDGGNQNL